MVPDTPSGYGGIEAMVHSLVEGLVDRGHEVVLVGAGPDQSNAKFLQTFPAPPPLEQLGLALPEIVHALEAAEHLEDLDVDVVHDHSVAGPLTWGWQDAPYVMTAHGPVDAYLEPYYRILARRFGEANTVQKKDLLARARCLVFPIQWDEPFGIVVVEAMACGTPVVALRGGSVPEVVEDGVTGFICDDVEELPDAIWRVDQIDPKACRRRVFDCFDVADMVDSYEALYRRTVLRASELRAGRGRG
jgi:Glycosyl transferases group 1